MLTHQFKTGVLLPNRPLQPSQEDRKNRTYNIILNSADKVAGTNAKAVYKVNLGTNPFKNPKIKVRMINFNPAYPTNTNGGIVFVNLNEMTDPLTYKSDTKNRHGVLGVVQLREGAARTYPLSYATTSAFWSYVPSTGSVASPYVVTNSTGTTRHQAFDNNTTTVWQSNRNYPINVAPYQCTGSTTAAVDLSGNAITITAEWIQIQLPTPIKVSSYTIRIGSSVYYPRGWYMLCSTNGTDWIWFDQRPYPASITTGSALNTYTCATPPNGYYKYYRLCVTNSNDVTQIGELRLIGTTEDQQISTTTGLPNKHPINNTHELVSVDKNMFDKLITIELTSPTVDVTNMNAYTMQLAVYDENEDEFKPS